MRVVVKEQCDQWMSTIVYTTLESELRDRVSGDKLETNLKLGGRLQLYRRWVKTWRQSGNANYIKGRLPWR